MIRANVTLNSRVLDGIIKHLDGNIADAIAKTAFTVEAKAKINAPVDTGALRASIYTSLKGGSKFSAASSVAQSLRPGIKTMELPKPDKNNTAYVGPSVEYGASVELGSTRRPGTPYLVPALRDTERMFKQLLKKAILDE